MSWIEFNNTKDVIAFVKKAPKTRETIKKLETEYGINTFYTDRECCWDDELISIYLSPDIGMKLTNELNDTFNDKNNVALHYPLVGPMHPNMLKRVISVNCSDI